ncbi:MAG: HAMP domain-containing histidine kinase [Lachnospiraceae bacterium]|nr:HAMP domain-containing histidine kinase [Lachnospiraceae bacterium]
MKRTFTGFFILETVILVAAVILLGITAFSYRKREIDIVTVNDYAQTVKEQWRDGSLDTDALPDARLMILGPDGEVLYRSDDKTFEGISSELDAIRKNMFCIPVTDYDRFLGTIVIPNPAREDYEHVIARILWTTAAIIAVIAISYVMFIWYVNRNVVRPFSRMKEFAAQVAQGNLDEPLLIEKNNMFGLFTESFDLMREELKASRNREIALKVKEKELVATLSHDLKSPVAGIRVICELLEAKVEDAYIHGKVETIRHKTEEMNVLLSDLLSTTLEDLGELNVNLSEVTSDILNKMVEEHDTKKKAVAQPVPGCVLCIDQNRLSQVIGNIIGNSYKYADTEIEVSYGYRDHYLEMKIHDHGEGVDEEELPLLTNKFYRGKKSAADKEGSGLGLYISAELMKKMNGQLILSCEGGFTATLLLPLA